MKKYVVSCCFFFASVHPVSEFVQVKKTVHEKPSKVKEEIVETLESLLTLSFDTISLKVEEQRLIVQKVREITQGQGAFEQKNPHELKRYRDSLKKMEEDFEKQTQHMQRQFAQLKKDFSHN
jgi:DNA-binding protein YbaB